MSTTQNKLTKMPSSKSLGQRLILPMAISLALLNPLSAFADNAVNLKVLVVTTGDATTDAGLAYIQPVLDEMGVAYDVFNATTQTLTAATLSPNGCAATTASCVGNYNGIILTDTEVGGKFTTAEWDLLHAYETNFHVREAVLSGWPATYADAGGVYLDYGLVYTAPPATPYNAQWSIPTTVNKSVFEYVNQANPLPVTDFAFAATPRNNGQGPKDGTIPNVTPLLKTPTGAALVSMIQYKMPTGTVARESMVSTMANAWFLTHSNVLAYEFINWATQGVYVGGRFVYMSAHLDDLFLGNELWNVNTNETDPNLIYRLSSSDISNAIVKQNAFRAAHPTAGASFKLDFPFNGSGAVTNPTATTLTINTADGLVQSILANKNQFRYINHTFTHADMDRQPSPANAACDYPTLPSVSAIAAEITKNRTVWGLLALPEQAANNRVLLTGNHSGLKDRKCTEIPELHPNMANVQSDDIVFWTGANAQFFQASANTGVDYIASDTSQVNQDVERYVTNDMVNDGSTKDRLMLPRYPTNIFVNTINPTELVDEYNYMFNGRFIALGQNPCTTPGAICTTRNYSEILTAEADAALRHMMSYKKFPHFFHQGNVAKYDSNGNTLQFDWLNAVYTAYEKLFKLPVRNLPYYQIGDLTKDRMTAKSATINAKWDRTANTVTLSANKAVPNLFVTGVQGGQLYGGQLIRQLNVSTTPQSIVVNQALTQ